MKVHISAVALRVLVVDDCEDMCASTAALLKLWGHDTRVAKDGAAALECAMIFRPDVVLLDLSMPGMDGHEVARHLRRQMVSAQPLLISLSGYGGADQSRRALEAGCDLHMIKPAEPEELRRLLESHRNNKVDKEFVTDWSGDEHVYS
jgi:two-component system CheB/CheR fusion protein